MRALAALLLAWPLFAQSYKVETPSGIVEMSSQDYVAGVVAGEGSVFRSGEALKALAIAARTYAARMRGRHSKDGFDFCSSTHCQRLVTASARSSKAARETAGQLLWFNGKPAFAVYTRSCGGRTESAAAVWPDIVLPGKDAPYLNSHADPYCSSSWTWAGSPEQIRQAVLQAGLKTPARLQSITVVRRTGSGRAQMLSLDGELVSASAFRFAIGRSIGWNALRSEQYTVESTGGRILFRGSGEGHGVGLCQSGADQMGLSGKSYRDILAFYYPGTSIGGHATAFHWTRLSGEGVAIYTLLPDSDRSLIAIAEGIIRELRERLPWPAPPNIDIYAYADLDSFRNATGEPGWVAARTSGTRIELQPAAVLRGRGVLYGTLKHELLHCFVESAARPGLPVWFREGLVEHLAGHRAEAGDTKLDNAALQQRRDRREAQSAYQTAQARVEALIQAYGEAAVLGWVVRGLPAGV